MGYYKFETEQYVQLNKKGFSVNFIKSLELEKLPLHHDISNDKKKDVKSLLNLLFGDDWETMEDERNQFGWYKSILQTESISNDSEEEVICECLEDEVGLKV